LNRAARIAVVRAPLVGTRRPCPPRSLIARIHVERASSCSDNTLSYSSAVICTMPERNPAAFAWTGGSLGQASSRVESPVELFYIHVMLKRKSRCF